MADAIVFRATARADDERTCVSYIVCPRARLAWRACSRVRSSLTRSGRGYRVSHNLFKIKSSRPRPSARPPSGLEAITHQPSPSQAITILIVGVRGRLTTAAGLGSLTRGFLRTALRAAIA